MSRSSQWAAEIQQQDELRNIDLEYREWLYFLGAYPPKERPPSDGDEQPEKSIDSDNQKPDQQ
jgi:hypothetical protein